VYRGTVPILIARTRATASGMQLSFAGQPRCPYDAAYTAPVCWSILPHWRQLTNIRCTSNAMSAAR